MPYTIRNPNPNTPPDPFPPPPPRRFQHKYAETFESVEYVPEPPPGAESKPSAPARLSYDDIEAIVCLKNNLGAVMAAVRKMGHLVCFDREYR